MASCSICDAKMEKTFMGKLLGTIVYDTNHKQQHVCPQCQKEYPSSLKEKINE